MSIKTIKYLTLALLLTISLFVRASSALGALFDLENLKSQNPSLVVAYDKIDIFRAWKIVLDSGTTFAERVRIGILDTGIDLSHGEFIKTVVDADVTSDLKKDGHGTQVAGIIGADNKSPAPIDSLEMNGLISGATDKYTLISRQVIGKKGFNIVTTIENMITEKSPHIVNISAGATRCSAKSLLGQFTNCISDKDFDNNKRIWNAIFSKSSSTLFIVGAGNDGVDASNTLPAAIDLNNVMTIAATDFNDARANFPFPAYSSNFGAVVDISAPGVNVYAPKPGNDYDTNFSGTSASAPLVTGVAGLIKAIKPGLAPAQIKDILVRNADSITTDKPIGGRLNALKAVCDPLVLNCTPIPTPFPNWIQKFPSMNPPARFGHAIAYDSARQQTVLFGGAVSGISGWSLASDTWTWDGAEWSLKLSPISPPADTTGQTYHTMAYDGARQQTVLFLGISCPYATAVKNYTWVWDGTTWISKSPATTPSARYGAAMVYDAARQQTVLFGGFGCGGWLNDTWAWDGATWTQKFPSTNPPGRDYHVMAYDSTRGQTLLFGGTNNGTILDDTWAWDGVNWSQKFPIVSPSARYSSVMVYDGMRQEAVLFGGEERFNIVNDTWTWDGAEWAQRNPENSPPPRAFSGATYDSARSQVMLFGGNPVYPPILFDDTWVLGP